MLQCRRSRLVASFSSALLATVALPFTPGTAVAQEDRPDFQLPFPCGDLWRLDTWGHAPALDMVKDPTQDGTEGALLVAPADGVVNQSFRHDNAGNLIQIDHGDDWFTTYIHLESRSVDVGDEISQGEEIGRVGRDGPTANDHPHLHFELAVNSGDSATWGFEGSDRVTAVFDGVEHDGGNNQTWRNVESNNCPDETPPDTAPTTTAPDPDPEPDDDTVAEDDPDSEDDTGAGSSPPAAEPVAGRPSFTG